MKGNMLSNFCRYNNSNDVSRFLSNNLDLDVTDDSGMCFKLALKNGNTKIMSLLLEYYEKQKLTADDNSVEYKVARHNLQNLLEDALQFYAANTEMYKVMSRYLPINKEIDEDGSSNDAFDEVVLFPKIDEVGNKIFYQNEKFADSSASTLIGNIAGEHPSSE